MSNDSVITLTYCEADTLVRVVRGSRSKGLLICCLLMLIACQPATKQEGSSLTPMFRDIAAETGLTFTHVPGATGKFYMPEIMGAGVGVLDYDGDGDLDIFLVQSGTLDSLPQPGGSRLFRNELIPKGKLSFTDVTKEAGLHYAAYGMGVATGDFNNDGHIDLLATNFGPNVLFANQGNGTFRDVTNESPATRKPADWSTSASFFDYDRDGWQDLIILSYVDFSIATNKRCQAPTGETDYCTPIAYRPVAARLYHNERGKFVDVTVKAGIDRVRGPGLGVLAIDVNQDGWPDLFVANDTAANHLWLNQKNGTFIESALVQGVAYSEDGQPKAGMGVAVGDYNNDGADDLLVLNLMREGATLFRNSGKGDFQDVSMATRIHALTFAYTGFGVGWFDFDNDGWLDLFLANGAVTRREDQRGQSYPFREKNLLLRNTGRGASFVDRTDEAGEAMRAIEISRGAAFGDIDNDGRVDLVIANNDGPARLLRNETGGGGSWVGVQLRGPGLGVGARVGVTREDAPTLWRSVRSDGSYLSASDLRLSFGLGTSKPTGVIAQWPDGSRQEQKGIKAGTRVVLSRR